MSDWAVEFPRLYRWRKPATFFADIVVTGERRYRKFLYLATCVLIGYVVFEYFKNFYAQGGVSNDLFVGGSSWGRTVWSVYRNQLYLLTLLDFVLILPSGIVAFHRNQFAKLVKTIVTSFCLLLFITFSYALAGLIVDLVFVGVTMHIFLMNAQGANLPIDPARLLLGK